MTRRDLDRITTVGDCTVRQVTCDDPMGRRRAEVGVARRARRADFGVHDCQRCDTPTTLSPPGESPTSSFAARLGTSRSPVFDTPAAIAEEVATWVRSCR